MNFDFSAIEKNSPKRMAYHRRPSVHHTVPIIVFLLGAVVSFLFAQKLYNDQSDHIWRLTTSQSQIIERKLVRASEVHVEMLQRMVARWQAAKGTPEALWREDAVNTLKHSKEVLSLSWIDREGLLQWYESTPYASTPASPSMNQPDPFRMDSVEGHTQMAILQSEPHKSVTLSHTVTISKDDHAVMISVPIWTDIGFEGYLNAFVNITSLFSQFLESDYQAGFSVCLHEGENVIFEKLHDPED